jgi:hypothetical protein
MTAEYTDTELAALPDGLIARAREAILSVRRYLDWYEVQAEITRVQAALQAGHRQLEQYIEDIDAGKPMGRMPISMSEILRGGKYFWGLAAVRREANLLIGVYCNEVLGDDSPYKDDVAIKLFGKYASYENWLAAVAALEPPQPRKRKHSNRSAEHRSAGVPPAPAGAVPAPAAVPRTNERSTSTERVPAKETAAAGKMPAAGAGRMPALRDEPQQGADEFSRVRERPEPRPTNIQEPRRGGTNGTGESPRAGEDARVPAQGSGGSPVPDA